LHAPIFHMNSHQVIDSIVYSILYSILYSHELAPARTEILATGTRKSAPPQPTHTGAGDQYEEQGKKRPCQRRREHGGANTITTADATESGAGTTSAAHRLALRCGRY
jgi:hypothetical protein